MKILMFHPGATDDDDLAADLREFGHDVQVIEEAPQRPPPAVAPAQPGTPPPFRPDVVVVRLDEDAAATLDAVQRMVKAHALPPAPFLFTGRNELALAAARRRFPDGSFARSDLVATALESLHQGE